MSPQLPLGIGLPAGAVFETFHPGGNRAAAAAVAAAAAGTGDPVLFLHGEVGSGRTHLLHAACAAASRAAYLPAGDYALQPAEMIDGWEAFGLVCIDDIGAFAGNASWERAMFALFNALQAAGGRWIATGDAPPGSLGFGLADLASRLAAGPVFRLQSLDDDGRVGALIAHAAQRGFELPEEVARYLIARIPRDMHSLVATLDRIDAESLSQKRKVTIPLVRELI